MAIQEKETSTLDAATLAAADGDEVGAVKARGYWEQVWRRFRRDRVAVASAVFILFLVFAAYAGAPIASHVLGHGPNDLFTTSGAVNEAGIPVGPWTTVEKGYPAPPGQSTLLPLGADGSTGRDELLRLLYGARVSLEVALGATLISMLIGVLLGAMAGYYRGWVDAVVSRFAEVTMAFPQLLFIIAIASTIGQRLNGITLGFLQEGVFTLVMVLGIFGWYYPARIMRSVVLSLREKEFIEAARMTGASDLRIIRSHLLPHLVAPIIVYSTLIIAQQILAEAGLSFLGIGIPEPTPSWGILLQSGPQFYTTQPWLMVWPGLAVLMTTLAFNLVGDGMRDAFDPRATR